MKVGDTVPVTIVGHVVAQAVVKETGEGTATLLVPATRVVMGVRTELTDLPTEEPTTEHIVDGVDRQSATVPDPAPVPAEVAPIEPGAPAAAPAPVPAPVAETPAPASEIVPPAPSEQTNPEPVEAPVAEQQ